MAHISRIYKLNRPQLNQVEGFTDSYEVNLKMQGNQLLDDRKIVILASRKWNMNKDKTEAEEYFAREGYKPRASNQYMILSDSLGH